MRETVVAWEERTSFTCTGEGIPFVKRARNRWSVEEVGDQTVVTSSSEIELKGNAAGRLLEPAMRTMSTRMARRSLASFNYPVEHGAPYEGHAKRLLPVPAGC